MREHARQMLSEGKGEPTLIAPIQVPTRATVVGALYDERICHVKREPGHRDYIPVDDIAALYEAAARDLMKMSPHPPDVCIAAVHKKYLTKVPVSLIRTPQANQEIEGDLRVAAEAERARSEVASCKVDELAELQAKGKLSGERYVEVLAGCSDLALIRQGIKLARTSDSALFVGRGSALGQRGEALPRELACSEPQRLQLSVSGFSSDCKYAYARLEHAGKHDGFWAAFVDRRLELVVASETDLRTLLLSAAVGARLDLELSVSVVLAHGAMNRDIVRASVISVLDHAGLVRSALQILTQQLRLDFGEPS